MIAAVFVTAALFVGGPVEQPPASKGPITVRLAHNDERSRKTRVQLLRLLKTYDLKRWYFTNAVVIDSGPDVIPHSSPTLTLSTRFLKDDDLLLATFLHEQLHWFLLQRPEATSVAELELESMYPNVPIGYPDGAQDSQSSYLHLLVCYLEARVLTDVIGELRAKAVIQFWATDHYRWIYRTILSDAAKLTPVLSRNGLLP